MTSLSNGSLLIFLNYRPVPNKCKEILLFSANISPFTSIVKNIFANANKTFYYSEIFTY